MSSMFFCMYPWVVLVAGIILLLVVYSKIRYRFTSVCYRYPLTDAIVRAGFKSTIPYKKIVFVLRFITLCLLALLLGKPQLVDPRSKIAVEGIDMVIALDVSGSMDLQYDSFDSRSRIQVAKSEAVRFVDKRVDDAIGLVLFAHDAVSRVPLTMDKELLRSVIKELQLGVIDYTATTLFKGLVAAANRLKHSTAKSKVIILLTDGEPSDGDLDGRDALAVVKRMGIKVYTIGIGSEQPYLAIGPRGPMMIPPVNQRLLDSIAQETGGRSFLAQNASDMRAIYDSIDSLEKVEREHTVFSRHHDYYMPFLWAVVCLVSIELLLVCCLWCGIW